MGIVVGIVLGLIGVVVGTKVFLWIQLVLFLLYIIYMNSEEVKRMEIGAMIPFVFGVVFFIGVLIGDISYAIQTDSFSDLNISNLFVVSK